MAHQKYPTYKNSGIEWLGEIPEHWEVRKLKYSLTIKNGSDYKHIVADKGFPVIGSGGQFAYATDYLYDGEVVLLGRKGTIDKPLYFSGKFWAVDTMFFAICKSNNNTKFHYYLATQIPFKLYSTSTALPSMTQSDLKDHYISLPPKPEQTAIANFLDEKLEKINRFIAKKKQLIALLQEQKAAIINDAVTKGLDKTVAMKDSGIEWLGEIPEGWEVRKLKHLMNYFKGFAFKSSDFVDSGFPIIKVSSIKKGIIKKVDTFIAPNNQRSEFENVRLSIGDIVITTVGSKPEIVNSSVGQIGIIDHKYENAYLNQNTVCLRPLQNIIEPKFSKYFLSSRYIRSTFDSISLCIVNQAYLIVGTILNIKIYLPPLTEQKAIVAYIETETQKIDHTIATIKKELDLVAEYKTALIAEAVTGKICLVKK